MMLRQELGPRRPRIGPVVLLLAASAVAAALLWQVATFCSSPSLTSRTGRSNSKVVRLAAAKKPAPAKKAEAESAPAAPKKPAPAPKAEAESVPAAAKKPVPAQKPEAASAPAAAKSPAPAPRSEVDDGNYYPGDKVMSRYHRDNGMYESMILYKKTDEIYDVSWDEPDEGEQISSVTIRDIKLVKRGPPGQEKIPNVPLKVGDKVLALFLSDQKFYGADLTKISDDKKLYTVKWDDPDGAAPTADLERHDVKLKLRKA
mmetsp:Transcript_17813/g.49407  ORF Transcript_17813/g.49407 Transcript_17813/m.49407 type:complete len:259 (-) Transcript_17813:98-874(-)